MTVLARHAADNLPAGARDFVAALDEGIEFEFGCEPRKVRTDRNGKPTAVECVRVKAGKDGKPRPEKGSAFSVAGTTVISALDYTPELADDDDELKLSAWGTVDANPFTGRTWQKGVFAGGDAVTATKSVIHAVGAGKRTALAIDAFLRGENLEKLEAKLAVYAGLPYLKQLADAEKLGELGRKLVRRDPVWLKMGSAAETGHARDDADRSRAPSARPASTRSRRATPPRPPRPRPSAACSAPARRWATATCSAWASSTASPTTNSSSPASRCATRRPRWSTPSSGAT